MPTIGEVIENQHDPYWAHAQAVHEIVFASGVEELGRLSPESRLAYLVGSFHGAVCNGGFDNFFSAPLGAHAAEIVTALKTLGAEEAGRILGEVLTLFPDGIVPEDREERDELWLDLLKQAQVAERVERLEQRYGLIEEPIESLRRYLVENSRAPLAT